MIGFTGILFAEQEKPENYMTTPVIVTLESPLKQFKSGISLDEIQCNERLIRVIKQGDNVPICIRSETISKLIERGWMFSSIEVSKNSDLVVPRGDLFLKQPLIIEGLNETQYVGQKIEFTIKFNGTKSGCHSYPSLKIENSEHQKVWEGNSIVELCDPDTISTHYEKIWSTSDSPLGTPIINQTGFYTLFAEFENNIIQKDFWVKSKSDISLFESDYNPYETRCGSGVVPFISNNWQSTGMHPSDETWENLGRHLVKQTFYQELKNRNIIFKPACFGVHTGAVEESYPPRFSMCTVVTESNGTKLYLEGIMHEFDVTNFDIDNEIPYQCDENHHGCLCGLENEN